MMHIRPSRFGRSAARFLVGCLGIAVVTLLGTRLHASLAAAALLYLFAAVLSALWGDLVPSLLVSIVAILCLDYFFVPPLHSVLTIDETTDVVALLAFSTTVFVITHLTSRARRAAAVSREQADLLDVTHDAIFVRDAREVITYWNHAAEELYGWKREDAFGKVTHDLLHTVFPMPREDIMATVLRAGSWEGEVVHSKRDGTQLTVASRWSLQRDDKGRPLGTLESNNDITERKRAEEALRRTQAELAHVTRIVTIGELTASIAHEVNQPLAGIVANASACLRWLAANPPDIEEARDTARRLIRDGNRASEVVARMRALAKKTPMEKQLTDLNEAIQEVLALAQGEVRRSKVLLRTELAGDLSPVLGDRVQLQQVVLNLVVNGIEAMSTVQDRPRDLLIRTQQSQNDEVCVTVQDVGVGLNREDAERIFDAFYTTKRDGMGMGLSISRHIVEDHGGRLWAIPGESSGAAFQFTIPRYR
jgi:two-component system, LuxR family, sensor kinase FixL